jgi:glycosyltransferase involved in cell wall biosynthesis
MSLRFSVVIPVYNSKATIARCLDSLAGIDYPRERFEIVLVDNGSTDGTLEILQKYPFRIVHENNKNAFSARNCGIAHSSGEIIVLTDSDCVVDPDWLKAYDESFNDLSVMACGGRIDSYAPNNVIEEFPVHTSTHKNEIAILHPHLFLPWIDTANAAYRRIVFDEIGLFDDIHFTITGDVDMGWRISLHGYRIGYNDLARVQHINRGTIRALMKQYYQYGYASVRIGKKYRHYYEKTLDHHGYSRGWEYRFMQYSFSRAWTILKDNASLKGLALWYLQICIGIAHIRGVRSERRHPRLIEASPAEREKVAPKPLRKGYLIWGDGEGKHVFDFATEKILEPNEFGAFILECINNNDTVGQIIEKACMEWDADHDTIRADVMEFIDNLQSAEMNMELSSQG